MSNAIREKLEEYFSTMNPTSGRMMADIKKFRQEYTCNWDELNSDQQSAIIWKCIVKPEAIKKYENTPANPVDVECFPVLKLRPGEKIIVEEDNVSTRSFGNSWRDEHSAPFRWETMSQLGLDLDEVTESQPDISVKSSEPVNELEKNEVLEVKETKKEEEVKRPATVKRPEVPPPPVPPHATPPPQQPVEIPPPPPPHVEKNDTPIYAKVVKRKSASSKTLVIGEMKAHRKAKEEMKPAVPPRMSLELKGTVDITKYKTLPIDIDGIPKTGFDFLDNW